MEDRIKYEGSCYIGVVGSENENGECRDTIESIERTEKDTRPVYIRATKGYEARQMHLNNWYEANEHPFLLLLDHDMKFPADTLVRLRSYGLPYMSGLYMRRRYNPIAPVWFDYGETGHMPMSPFTAVPAENTLYKIGASGWGCVLIHRDVVTAVKKVLKGEPEILEDDMDLYPYDLGEIVHALNALDKNPEGGDARKHIEVLKKEIRPLRGVKDPVGSDIRFPFYARLAGFDLIGDSGVLCEHMLNYPINPTDYINQSARNVRDLSNQTIAGVAQERKRIEDALKFEAIQQNVVKVNPTNKCWHCQQESSPGSVCIKCGARL